MKVGQFFLETIENEYAQFYSNNCFGPIEDPEIESEQSNWANEKLRNNGYLSLDQYREHLISLIESKI